MNRIMDNFIETLDKYAFKQRRKKWFAKIVKKNLNLQESGKYFVVMNAEIIIGIN